MAHFAQLDENNQVIQVIVVNNNDCQVNGVESEDVGIAFCQSLFGENTVWKQTSYNANFRKNYAGIGYVYDATRDAFIPPQPAENWTFNENTCRWDAPVPRLAGWVLNEVTCQWEPPFPRPNDGNKYMWDEQTFSWVQIQEQT